MRPIPDTTRHDSSSESSPLEAVIQSDLCAASWHAEQTRHVEALRDKDAANRKAEKEASKLLFDISCITLELIHERSPQGEYLRARFHLLFLPIRPPRFQIIAPAGMGKTRECVTQVSLLAGCTVNYFVPTHDLVQELVPGLQAAGYRCVHPVLGRTAPGMCKLDDIAELSRDIATAGLSVQGVLCGNPENEDGHLCPYFHECEYQTQRLALGKLSPPPDQPLIYVLPSAYLASWPKFLPRPDFKIIDESCWQQFVQKSKLQLTDLQRIAQEAPTKTRRVLQSIAAALGAGTPPLKTLREHGLTQREDFKAAKTWLTKQIKDRAKCLVKSQSVDFRKLQPWAATRHLVSQLSHEIEFSRTISHSISFPDCESPNTKHLIGIYSRHIAEQNIPIMLLDASADPAINARIFGKIETHTVDARRNASIYQVRGKSFSRQSILGVDAFGNPMRPEEAAELLQGIVRFIIARLDHHSRILVVAQLRVSELLEGLLQPYINAGRILMTHFSALRGLNTFEDCDAAIIIGREQPSPGAVEALARALYWDDPKPLFLGHDYSHMPATRNMADGSTETERIQQHPDTRINGILRQIREREIEQAIDRIRLIHNPEPKTVYLLTCIPIEAEITATASWRQFRGTAQYRIGRAILRSIEQIGTITVGSDTFEAVVLPFGRELGRCFPEIWPSPDAARDGWRDGGKLNGGCLQIELSFGIAPHLILAYRRPGQRGQHCRALVAIRPTGAAHTPSDGDGGANPTDIRCAPTGRKSPPLAIPLDPYANSEDDLRAVAEIALQRLIGPAKIISIETKIGR